MSGVALRLAEDKRAFSENGMKDSVNKSFQSKQQGNLSKVTHLFAHRIENRKFLPNRLTD